MSSFGPNLTYHVLLFWKKVCYAIATKLGDSKGGGGKKEKCREENDGLDSIWRWDV